MIPGGRRGRRTRNLPANATRAAAEAVAIGAVAVLLAAGLLTGCGGSDTSASAGTDGAASASGAHHQRRLRGFDLAAEPNRLRYFPSVLRARSGNVTINFVNHAGILHNLHVAMSRGVVLGHTPTFSSGTKTLKLQLKPGRYVFYCSMPGHRAGGMHGTLIVR